jgi:hypothetical protein
VVTIEDVVVVSEVNGLEIVIKVLISSLSLSSQIRSESASSEVETMLVNVLIV